MVKGGPRDAWDKPKRGSYGIGGIEDDYLTLGARANSTEGCEDVDKAIEVKWADAKGHCEDGKRMKPCSHVLFGVFLMALAIGLLGTLVRGCWEVYEFVAYNELPRLLKTYTELHDSKKR